MDKAALLTISLIMSTIVSIGGIGFWIYTESQSDSKGIIVKSGSCIQTETGHKFHFNVYNPNNKTIEKDSIKITPISTIIFLVTSNEVIEPETIGRATSIHNGELKEKNIRFELTYKNSISNYVVNC